MVMCTLCNKFPGVFMHAGRRVCQACMAKAAGVKSNYLKSYSFSDGEQTMENEIVVTELPVDFSRNTDFIDKSTVCTKCGIDFSKFKQTQKMGCPDCYNSFRKQIITILRKLDKRQGNK